MSQLPGSSAPVRWTTSDRGFRHYAPVGDNEVHESSAASQAFLWVNGEHMALDVAEDLRDAQPPGLWRDTLNVAIVDHYQEREPLRSWQAGDVCTLCGSTDTHLTNDKASCNGCGAQED